MTLRSNFLINTINYFNKHKLSLGLLPWPPKVCRKMFFLTTDGNVVENFIIYKIIHSFNKFILFYFILFMFYVLSTLLLLPMMLWVIMFMRSQM